MSTELHLDTGVLALHAMPADELADAQAHVDSCPSCSAELAGFIETAALLGAVSAEVPPASLRRTIMARVAVTPQLPPVTGGTPAPIPLAPETTGPTDRIGGAGQRAGRHRAGDGSPATVRPLRPWYRRPVALIAAAVAAVVIGGGTVVVVNQLSGQNQQVAQTPEQCVAQAADRKELTPQAGQGKVTYAPSCSAVTVDVMGLPSLPSDQTYQLWAIAQQPRSLGLLPEAAAGQQQLVTEETKPGETVVAITAEPAGGSAAPTLPIVWMTELTS